MHASQSYLSSMNESFLDFASDSSNNQNKVLSSIIIKEGNIFLANTGLKRETTHSLIKVMFLKHVTCCQKDNKQQYSLKSL